MGCGGIEVIFNEQRKLKKKIEELDFRFDIIKKETSEKLLEIENLKELTEELKTELNKFDVESNQKLKQELRPKNK